MNLYLYMWKKLYKGEKGVGVYVMCMYIWDVLRLLWHGPTDWLPSASPYGAWELWPRAWGVKQPFLQILGRKMV